MTLFGISTLDFFLIAINIGLFIFAGEIYQKLTPRQDSEQSHQVHLLRVINGISIGLILYKAIVAPAIEDNWLSKALTVSAISYVFFMVFKVYWGPLIGLK